MRSPSALPLRYFSKAFAAALRYRPASPDAAARGRTDCRPSRPCCADRRSRNCSIPCSRSSSVLDRGSEVLRPQAAGTGLRLHAGIAEADRGKVLRIRRDDRGARPRARGGTPATPRVAWISRTESAAARAFGVSTGTSTLIAPVPACIQDCATPITSARCSAVSPPRPRPTNTTIGLIGFLDRDRMAQAIVVGNAHRRTSRLSWTQAPSATATPTSAPAMRRLRPKLWDVLAVIGSNPASVGDKAVGAAIAARRLRIAAGHAIDAIEIAEQLGLRIGRRGEAVIRTRQVLLRHRAHDVGRHQHHQFGLVVDEVAAAEQRAEDRQLHHAGQAVDRLLGLLLDQAGHRHRAAGGNFQRGFGAARLDRGNRRSAGAALQRVFVGDLGDFGHHVQADPPFGQDDRGEVERNTELLEADGLNTVTDRARRARLAGHAGRNRKFAAGDERRGFAGDRRSDWARRACARRRRFPWRAASPAPRARRRSWLARALPGTSGALFAVNGLVLANFTTEVP